MSESVLILGATSAIARATAAAFAARGDALYLASRDEEELRRIAADLRLRYGVEVRHGAFDAEATATHEVFFSSVLAAVPDLSGVVLAFGYLGDQHAARDFSAARKSSPGTSPVLPRYSAIAPIILRLTGKPASPTPTLMGLLTIRLRHQKTMPKSLVIPRQRERGRTNRCARFALNGAASSSASRRWRATAAGRAIMCMAPPRARSAFICRGCATACIPAGCASSPSSRAS